MASTQGAGAGNNKIFFVSTPSLIYPKRGPGAAPDPSGGIAPLIRSLELLGKEHPEILLETSGPPDALIAAGQADVSCLLAASFVNITLPAIPILNQNRFYHHLRSYPLSESLYPSRILTGILAHSIMYNPELRAKQTEVWVEVYETLTYECVRPCQRRTSSRLLTSCGSLVGQIPPAATADDPADAARPHLAAGQESGRQLDRSRKGAAPSRIPVRCFGRSVRLLITLVPPGCRRCSATRTPSRLQHLAAAALGEEPSQAALLAAIRDGQVVVAVPRPAPKHSLIAV